MTDLDFLLESTTIRYDDRAGCGLNVARRAAGEDVFVSMTFVTPVCGFDRTHDLTLAQADQLRAVLDALTRTETGSLTEDVCHIVVGLPVQDEAPAGS